MTTPDTSGSGTHGPDTKNRLLIPLAAVVVATLVIALTYAVSSRSPGSPAVLQLAGAGPMGAEGAPAAAGTSADSRSSASGAYTLSGELPAGQPADAPVYELAGPYDTSRLATALDRRGLTVERGAWWWSQYQTCPVQQGAPASKPGVEPAPMPPDTPVSSDESTSTVDEDRTGCAVSGGGTSSSGNVGSGVAEPAPDDSGKVDPADPATEPGPEPTTGSTEPAPSRPEPAPEPTTPAMTTAQARAAAAPVFDAVDLAIDDAEVTVSPWGASVWINPVVKGLATVGYATRVELGRDKKISYASGFLGDLNKGDTYPLISAREAFDELPAPMTDMMCRVGPNGQGCEPPPKQEITGAVLGLAMQQTSTGDHLLVPAWLFAVKAWTEPLPQVAVEGRYVGEPAPPQQTEPVGRDGGGTDGSDGQTEPAVVDPAPPAVPPGG